LRDGKSDSPGVLYDLTPRLEIKEDDSGPKNAAIPDDLPVQDASDADHIKMSTF
jgi:hypothetical protein